MKYALISEEQIKNLKGLTSVLIRLGHSHSASFCAEILESLKPSEPVAYMQDSIEFYASEQQTPTFNKPLYALDGEQA